MMKRILVIFFAFLTCICLFSCQNSKDDSLSSDTENKKDHTHVFPEHNEEEIKENTYVPGHLQQVNQIPNTDLIIGKPLLDQTEIGHSTIFNEGNNACIVFTYFQDDEADSIETSFNSFLELAFDNIEKQSLVKDLDDFATVHLNINNIDAIRFTKTFEDDTYIYGYSFVLNGHPCSILACVENSSKSELNVRSRRDTANEMLRSIRIGE